MEQDKKCIIPEPYIIRIKLERILRQLSQGKTKKAIASLESLLQIYAAQETVDVLENFVDIDEIISPEGRPNMACTVSHKDSSVPTYTLPHEEHVRRCPEWNEAINIGGAMWSMANLDFVDCEDIEEFDVGIRFYCGTYYYNFEAAKRVVKKLDGWHIPSANEWLEAAKRSYFSRKEFRIGEPFALQPGCTWSAHVQTLTAKLAMLPTGIWKDSSYRDDYMKTDGFGDYASFWLSNGGTVQFTSSLSNMCINIENDSRPKVYMPLRLVRDRDCQ